MKVKDSVASYGVAKKSYTYQDYLELPDDGNRYEIIEGELVMPPAPYTIHQEIKGNIYFEMRKFINKNRTGKIYDAPTDVVLSDIIVVQPDILFISKENLQIITLKNIKGVPDLIVEIISPSTEYYDLFAKKETYERSGIKEYWLVDPQAQWVEIYLNVNQKFKLHQRLEQRGTVKSIILTGFQLDLDIIFDIK